MKESYSYMEQLYYATLCVKDWQSMCVQEAKWSGASTSFQIRRWERWQGRKDRNTGANVTTMDFQVFQN